MACSCALGFSSSSPAIVGEPQVGRFRTAPAHRKSVSFIWSGDTAGGGWGIDLARGGMRTYATMLANRPDFFIHSGDIIYADCAIGSQYKLPNGEMWRNVVTEEKSKVAETLAEFRGNYKYNLTDANLRAFNAEVPIFAQWDDHEVTDDWAPGGSVRGGSWAARTGIVPTSKTAVSRSDDDRSGRRMPEPPCPRTTEPAEYSEINRPRMQPEIARGRSDMERRSVSRLSV